MAECCVAIDYDSSSLSDSSDIFGSDSDSSDGDGYFNRSLALETLRSPHSRVPANFFTRQTTDDTLSTDREEDSRAVSRQATSNVDYETMERPPYGDGEDGGDAAAPANDHAQPPPHMDVIPRFGRFGRGRASQPMTPTEPQTDPALPLLVTEETSAQRRRRQHRTWKVPIDYLTARGSTLRSALMGYTQPERRRGRRRRVAMADGADDDDDDDNQSNATDDSGSATNSTSSSSTHMQRTEVTLRRFDTLVAFRAAYDYDYYETPTGSIQQTDILLHVFLWLPAEQECLLAVSGVSRAWREATQHMPQWAVVPQLLNPHRGISSFAFLVGPNSREKAMGYAVESRNDYMATMKERCNIKNAIRRRSKLGVAKRVVVDYLRLITVSQFLAAALLSAFCLAFASGVAIREVKTLDRSLNSDAKLGTLIFFLPFCFTYGLLYCFYKLTGCIKARTTHQKNVRFRGRLSFMLSMAIILIMLPCPFSLISARLFTAMRLRDLPTVTFGLGPGECSNLTQLFPAASSPSAGYVRIANPWDWTIQPFVNGRSPAFNVSSANLNIPLNTMKATSDPWCTPPANLSAVPPQWWGDVYLNTTTAQAWQSGTDGFGGEPMPTIGTGVQCFDRVALLPSRLRPNVQTIPRIGALSFVMLHPPDYLVDACPTAAPIALAYPLGDSTMTQYFNDSLRALWVSNATRAGAAVEGHLTTFRAPVETAGWFPMDSWAINYGHAWYDARRNRTEVLPNLNDTDDDPGLLPWPGGLNTTLADTAVLWEGSRVPVIFGGLEPESPQGLVDKWMARFWLLPLLALGLLGFNFLVALTPRRCVRGTCINVAWFVLLVLFINVFWLMAWGGVCYFQWHPDTCLMSKTSALAMFILGIVVTVAGVVIPLVNDD